MRVALVVPQFAYPLTGGVGPHARKLAEAMACDGDEILIISDGDFSVTPAYAVASVGTTWTPRAALRAIAAIRAFRPDAVLFEYTTFNFGGKSVAPLLIAVALRLRRIRQAAYIHEIFYSASSRAVKTPLHAALFWLRDILFTVSVGRFFVANDKKRERFLRFARLTKPVAVSVLPIGANIEPGPGGIWKATANDRRTIVSFGVVMPRRRFELIIDAVARLVSAGHDLQLLLVGNVFDHDYADRCIALASERGMADRITITGAVSDASVSAALHDSALFAYALEDGLISSSGTLLAALAHGMPIVSTTSSHDEPKLRAAVFAIEPNAEAFANGIQHLLGDAKETGRLGSAAADAYDRNFRWSTIVGRLRTSLA